MLDAFDLTGRTVIVTGASRGIGRTTAEVLAAAGANVVAVARTESALHSLVQDIAGSGGKALAVRADANVPEDTEMLVERTMDAFGTVDVLVNNAGEAGRHGAMKETSLRRIGTTCWRTTCAAHFCAPKPSFPLWNSSSGAMSSTWRASAAKTAAKARVCTTRRRKAA